jgi:hypothetical protein
MTFTIYRHGLNFDHPEKLISSLYDAFSVQNSLKQENALLSFFNFTLEFTIQAVQEN